MINLSKMSSKFPNILRSKVFWAAPASLGLLYYGTGKDLLENKTTRGQKLHVNPEIKDHHNYTLKNHVWSDAEIQKRFETRFDHVAPEGWMDKATYWILRGVYSAFNFMTRFDKNDPSPSSMKFRLILLESVAGVPPFIMGGYRHFRSLRNMSYDGGRIFTHMEEAENERMHLIICMQLFEAAWYTKAAVVVAQILITPFCWFFCLLNPRYLNRFVGYLEELACETYGTVLEHISNPEKQLHVWNEMKAPPVAIQYYDLEEGATWPDTLKRIYADETMHRDVNHTFAGIAIDARNPLLSQHEENIRQK